MENVFDAVRRIRNRIHYALTIAQRAWVSWVFKPSKQEKPSIEPNTAKSSLVALFETGVESSKIE